VWDCFAIENAAFGDIRNIKRGRDVKTQLVRYIIENAAKVSWDDVVKSVPDDAPLEERLQDIIAYLEKLAQSAPIKPKY